MKQWKTTRWGRAIAIWGRSAAVAGVALCLGVVAVSCQTGTRPVELPSVPGATYLGSSECDQCHPEIYKTFRTADHYGLIAQGPNALDAGCESCHGPGSLHAESGGEVSSE
jgi:hypothetical protein